MIFRHLLISHNIKNENKVTKQNPFAPLFLTFFLILFLSSFSLSYSNVYAVTYTLNSYELLYNAKPLHYIRPSYPVVVQIKINLTGNKSDLRVYINAENLSSKPQYRTTGWRAALCNIESGFMICKINAKLYVGENFQPSATIRIINKTNTSDESTEQIYFNLQIDTDRPYAEDFSINYCYDCIDEFFIGPHTNRVNITFGRGPVSNGFITLKVGTARYYPVNCTPNMCSWDFVLPSCRDGEVIPIKIVEPSKDDALNEFDYSQGTPEIIAICDATPPELLEVNITSTDPLGENVFLQGDQVIVTAKIKENSGGVIFLNASEFGVNDLVVGYCDPTESLDNFICTASFSISREGPYTGKLKMTIKDYVGNELKTTHDVEVSKGMSRKVSIWELESKSIEPRKLPTPIISKSGYEALVKLEFKGSTIGEIVSIGTDYCIVEKGDEQVATCTVDSVIIDDRKKASLFVYFDPSDQYGEGDELILNLSLYSKIRRRVYLEPQKIEVDLPLHFYETPIYPDKISMYKDEYLEKMRKDIEEREKAINNLIRIEAAVTGICELLKRSHEFQAVLDTSSAAFESLSALPVATPTAHELAKQLQGTSKKMSEEEQRTMKKSNFDLICKLNSCEINLLDLGEDGKNIKENLQNSNWFIRQWYKEATDPYRSLWGSIIHVCVPGIINQLNIKLAIDKKTLECMDRSINYFFGEGLTECQSAKDYAECTYIGSQLLLFTPLSVFNYIEEVLVDMAKNPIKTAISFSLSYYLHKICNPIEPVLPYVACSLPQKLIAIQKEVRSIARIANSVSLMLGISHRVNSYSPEEYNLGLERHAILDNVQLIMNSDCKSVDFDNDRSTSESLCYDYNSLTFYYTKNNIRYYTLPLPVVVHAEQAAAEEGKPERVGAQLYPKEKILEEINRDENLTQIASEENDEKQIERTENEFRKFVRDDETLAELHNTLVDYYKQYDLLEDCLSNSQQCDEKTIEELKEKLREDKKKIDKLYSKFYSKFTPSLTQDIKTFFSIYSFLKMVSRYTPFLKEDKENEVSKWLENTLGVLTTQEVAKKFCSGGIKGPIEIKKLDIQTGRVEFGIAILNAYRAPNMVAPENRNEENKGKYLYQIDYYISNPNEEESMSFSIYLNNKKIGEDNVAAGDSTYGSLSFTTDDEYNMTCIKVENGEHFFPHYGGEGICTSIVVIK